MLRSLAVVILLSASVASAATGAPRCNRGGGTILVFHDYDDCGTTGDPNEIDPWNFNGSVATPAGGSPLYTGGWRVGATADFNGDDLCDVVWTLGAGPELNVDVSLSQDGDFVPPDGMGGGQLFGAWTLVGASDYLGLPQPNGRPTAPDGSPDLVVWNRDTGQLGVWIGDGAGGLPASPYVLAGRDLAWQPMVLANLDASPASPTSEIVWRHSATGHLSYTRLVFSANGAQHLEGEPLKPEAPGAAGWTIRAADDFNGDGREDLVFQHEVSDKVVVWHMNGGKQIGGTFLDPDRLAPGCALETDTRHYLVVGPR